MGELQTVSNVPIAKVWNNQRVVTFKDIDEVHQRPSGTAKRNFNKNKKHFIENEDFYKISPDEFRTAFLEDMDNRQQNDIMLFTEIGYLMLVKSFRDDLSWNVQRQLVNGYFRGCELEQDIKGHDRESLPFLKDNDWLSENEDNFKYLCEVYDIDRKKLYHYILLDIGKVYDVDKYKALYKREVGHPAKYIMQVVAYFPELREEADKTIYAHIEHKRMKALERLKNHPELFGCAY